MTRQASVFLVLALPVFAVVPLTGDRSGTVLIASAAFAVCAIAMASARRTHWGLIAIVLAGLGGYLAFMSQQPFVQLRAEQFLFQVTHFNQSPYGQITQAVMIVFEQHWPTGIGFKVFEDFCAQLKEAGEVRFCSSHAHNPYLQWIVVGGLPGLLFWCGLVLALVIPGLKLLKGRKTRLAAAFGLASLHISVFPLQVSQDIFSNWPGLLAWTSFGVTYAGFRLLAALPGDDDSAT